MSAGPVASPLSSRRARLREFWSRVYQKSTEDNIFFKAGAGFGWYVTSVADCRSAYGNLATIVVLLFWIYYGSVVFVLSGEVAQVYTMRNARKVQILLAFGGSA